MKRLLLAVVFAIPGAAALAAELADVAMPDAAEVAGQELVLNGMGLREKFFVDVYVGGLYLPAQTAAAEEAVAMAGPNRLVMHFVHDAPADKVIAGWVEGFANNNDQAMNDAIAERLQRFNEFFTTDIKEGDIVVMDYVPGEGTHVGINNEAKGTIEGEDFNRALRAVWLGPKPPTEDFRDGLLGAAD